MVPKAPPLAGLAALVLSAPVYGLLAWAWPDVAYLHRMVATLVALLLVMAAITARPPPEGAAAAAGSRGLRHAPLPSGARRGRRRVVAVLVFFWVFR